MTGIDTRLFTVKENMLFIYPIYLVYLSILLWLGTFGTLYQPIRSQQSSTPEFWLVRTTFHSCENSNLCLFSNYIF